MLMTPGDLINLYTKLYKKKMVWAKPSISLNDAPMKNHHPGLNLGEVVDGSILYHITDS